MNFPVGGTILDQTTTVISEAALDAQRDCCQSIQAYWHSRGTVPTAFVDTYGCQQNEADSERIRKRVQT